MPKKHRRRKTRKKRGAGCNCEKNERDIKVLYNLVNLLPSVASYAAAHPSSSTYRGGRRKRRRKTRRKRIKVRPGYCAFLVRKKQCKERAVEGEWLCEKHGSRCYGRGGKIKKSCRLRSRYILNRLYPKKSRRRRRRRRRRTRRR